MSELLRKEFEGKCPECRKQMKIIYTSKDGKAKFYQCKKEHKKNRVHGGIAMKQMKIPTGQREQVQNELVGIAERLCKECGLSIPDVRRMLHELLDVSV